MVKEAVDIADVSDDALVDGAVSFTEDPIIETITRLLTPVVDQVQSLTEQMRVLQTTPRTGTPLPQARTTGQVLKELEGVGTTAKGQRRIDPLDPSGQHVLFKPDDIVKLVDEDKLQALQASSKVKIDDEVLGVVKAFMYRRNKDHKRKYKVDFPAYGEDGVMEDQITLIRAAG
jgi:hypothetical protein